MANLSESVTIHPEEMRELWVPTKADPSKEVRSTEQMPNHIENVNADIR